MFHITKKNRNGSVR